MALLSREGLLKKEKLEIKKVTLTKDDFVYVKQMTGKERDLWEESLLIKNKDAKGNITYERSTENFRAKLAEKTVCDKDGNLILQEGDYVTLSNNMSAKTLEKIVNTAQELNLISDEDRENLVKNSESSQIEGSTLDSVKN